MARVEPSTVKHATILGTRIELPSKDDIKSAGPITLFKKLGLQGVSEDKQKIIIQSFYDNPSTAETTLSLKDYPAVQNIVKDLLIDLIHKQDRTLSILKDDAMKDDSIIISYQKKSNQSIELSVLIPGHLLMHNRSLHSASVKANGLTKNGLENSKITTRTTQNAQMAQMAQTSQTTIPTLTTLPAVPTMPAVPTLPTLPAVPTMPAVPTLPTLPAVPTATTPTIHNDPVKVDATNAFIISIVDDVSITGSMNGEIDEDYLKKVSAENDTDANTAIASAVAVMEDDFINGTIKGLSRIHAQKHIKNSKDATKVDEILHQIVAIGDTKAKHHMCSLFAPPSSSSSSSFAPNKRITSLFDTFLSIHEIDVISKRKISKITNKVKVEDKNSIQNLNSDNKLKAYHSFETTFYNDMCGAIPPLSTLFTNFDAIPIDNDDINTLKTQLPYKVSILNENNSKTLSDMVNILQILYALSHITQLIEYMLYDSSSFGQGGGPILSRINYDPPTRAIPESGASNGRPVTYASTIGQSMKGLSANARRDIMQLIKKKTGATELTVGLVASDTLINALSDDDKDEIELRIKKHRKIEKIGISTTSSKVINIKNMMLAILKDNELLKEIEFVHNNPKYVGKIDVNMQNLKEKIMRMIIAATPGLVDETEKINVSVTNYDAQINDILKDVNSKITLLKNNDAPMTRLLHTIHLLFGKERPTKTIYSGVLFDAIHRMDAKDMGDILTIISEIDTVAIEITKTQYDENDKLVVLFFTLIKLQKRLLDIQSGYLLQYITTLFTHSSQTCSMMMCSYLLDHVSTVDELKYALRIFPMPATKTMPDMMVIIDNYNESIQHMIHDQFILYNSMLDILDFGTPSKSDISNFVTDISTQLTIAKNSSDTIAKEIGPPLARELVLPDKDGETLISEVYRYNIERVSSINLPIKQELLSKLKEIKLRYLMEKRTSTSYLEDFRKTLYKNVKGEDEPVLHEYKQGVRFGRYDGARFTKSGNESVVAPVSGVVVAPVSASVSAPVSGPVNAPVSVESISIEVKNSEEDADIAVAAVVAIMENEDAIHLNGLSNEVPVSVPSSAAISVGNVGVILDDEKEHITDLKQTAEFKKLESLQPSILIVKSYLDSVNRDLRAEQMYQDLHSVIKILEKNEITRNDIIKLDKDFFQSFTFRLTFFMDAHKRHEKAKEAKKAKEAEELAKEIARLREEREIKKKEANAEASNFTQSVLNASAAAKDEENARISEEMAKYAVSLRTNKELLERYIASLTNGTDMQKDMQRLLQVIIDKLNKIENNIPLVQSNMKDLSKLKISLGEYRKVLSRRNIVKAKYKTIGKAINKLKNASYSDIKSELIKMREILDRNQMTFEDKKFLLEVPERTTMTYISDLPTNEAEEKAEISKYAVSLRANKEFIEKDIESLAEGEVKNEINMKLIETAAIIAKIDNGLPLEQSERDNLRELHLNLDLYRKALDSRNMMHDRHTSIQYHTDAGKDKMLDTLRKISNKDEIELEDLPVLLILHNYISKIPTNDDEKVVAATKERQKLASKASEEKRLAEEAQQEAARQLAERQEEERRHVARQDAVKQAKAANTKRISNLRNISQKRSNNQNNKNTKNNISLRNNALRAAMAASTIRNEKQAKQQQINNQAARQEEANRAKAANIKRIQSLRNISEKRTRNEEARQLAEERQVAKKIEEEATAIKTKKQKNKELAEAAAEIVRIRQEAANRKQRENAEAAERKRVEDAEIARKKQEDANRKQRENAEAVERKRVEDAEIARKRQEAANRKQRENAEAAKAVQNELNRRAKLAEAIKKNNERIAALKKRQEEANRTKANIRKAEVNRQTAAAAAEERRIRLKDAAAKQAANAAKQAANAAKASKLSKPAAKQQQFLEQLTKIKEQKREQEIQLKEIKNRENAAKKQKYLNAKQAHTNKLRQKAEEEEARLRKIYAEEANAARKKANAIAIAKEKERIDQFNAQRKFAKQRVLAESIRKKQEEIEETRKELTEAEARKKDANVVGLGLDDIYTQPIKRLSKVITNLEEDLQILQRQQRQMNQQGGKRRTKNHTQRNRRTKNLTRRKHS
jgi:hypothetical protein